MQDDASTPTSTHGASRNLPVVDGDAVKTSRTMPVGDHGEQEAIQRMWAASTCLGSHDKRILTDDEIWAQVQDQC